MIPAVGPMGLISVTAALLAVPVVPAFHELHKRNDAGPLPTSTHDGRIENFAERFRSQVEPLRAELEQCCASGEVRRTQAPGIEVLLLGRDDFDFDPMSMQAITTVLASHLHVPCGRTVHADLYSAGDLSVGEGSVIRAAQSEGDIRLGPNSTALRWVHAGGRVHLQQGSTSYGRLSALDSILLEPGSSFEHMHAPLITTAEPDREDEPSLGGRARAREFSRNKSDRQATPGIGDVFRSHPRVRVHGDFLLPAGETSMGNVIATGSVGVGARSKLLGSVKSYQDMFVDEGARVQGSIICGGTLYLGSNCFVAGPVMAERDVVISAGVSVGTAGGLTTISSHTVQMARECRVHGTIWARVRGSVGEECETGRRLFG